MPQISCRCLLSASLATCVFFVAIRGTSRCAAAESPAAYECRWASTPIVVDGRANEAAWQNAAPIDGFHVAWEKNRTPRTATRAKLLWDSSALYFFADMDDGDLVAHVTKPDGPTWEDDVFELFFKPAADKKGYYEFEVNAVNTHMEMFIPERSMQAYVKYGFKDPFAWQTAVARRGTLNDRGDRDAGWSVEGRIPWADLVHTGGRPVPDEVWTFTLARYDYDVQTDEPDLSASARLTKPNYHWHEDYTGLRFVGPTPADARPYGIDQRVPLTTSKVVGSPDPPLPFRVRRAFEKLTLNRPIIARLQPGTNLLLAVVQTGPGPATSIVRFADVPEAGGDDAKPETLIDLDGVAYDITFHPDFAKNGYAYVGWNGPSSAKPAADGTKVQKFTRVSRFTIDRKPPYKFDPQSELRIIEWPSDGHNGGAVAFGNDRMLYVTSGDGTSDSDDDIVGQDMTKLLAKTLRIDVDHVTDADRAAGRNYSVPRDNPFVDLPEARPETWAYGFRAPWRMAVDPQTGHLWVTQNGQDLFEQVYFVRRGDNFGWSVTEGSAPFYLERKRGPTPIVPPAAQHPHSEARSLTGGVVYYGEKFPELRGAYVYGDYSTGKIWAIKHDGRDVTWHQEIADTSLAITGFALDSHGELLICDYQPEGAIYTLEPTPPAGPSTFPRTLAASGLFVPGAGHTVAPGVIPYSVNSPLWSDGTYKERFLALPGTEVAKLTARRSWELPEGTVLVKSFALETTAGDPSTRRWIETRFLTKQQNEWIGYSYAWNDEQTDAALVESKGADRTFTVRDAAAPGGKREQTWHFPSRAECMVCHSRAANYVLGVSTAQLNRVYDYGGTCDNQLRTLTHLGVIAMSSNNDLKEGVLRAAEARGLNSTAAEAFWNKSRPAGNQRTFRNAPELEPAYDDYPRLADPYDESLPVEARARSYLHANCAHCHVPAGGGNAQFDITHWTPAAATRTIDVPPLHAKFDLPEAKIIAPGKPASSTLWHRMQIRGRGQMPPLASVLVDRAGVKVVGQWIASLPPQIKPAVVKPDE